MSDSNEDKDLIVIPAMCLGFAIAFILLFLVYDPKKEESQMVATQSSRPVEPRWHKSNVVYVPLKTPRERIEYGHHDIQAVKPQKIWATENMRG